MERILEGLLDGSLGSEWEHADEEEGKRAKGKQKATPEKDGAFAYDVSQRMNVFDNEELDVARVRIGKQNVE